MPAVVSKDGTKIAYVKKGQGPVLILVLGALNRRGQGKKLTELLSDTFTVISYDRRGRGDSTDTLPYSTEKEVEDIEALIDSQGTSAHLYGHSSGCVLALLAAKSLNDKVSKLALYELPYNPEPNARNEYIAYKSNLTKLILGNNPGAAVTLFVKSVGVSEKQIAAMEQLPMWKGLTAMAHTLVYDTVQLMEQYPALNTNIITTKSLILYGTLSPPFMASTAIELSQKMPNATLHAVNGQSHDIKAEVLAPVLSEFFLGLS